MPADPQSPAPPWLADLMAALAPRLRQAAYGNLRAEVTRWEQAGGGLLNLALVYELPGGSSDQVNVTWEETPGLFRYLDASGGAERQTTSAAVVHDAVLEAVTGIPALRRRRLREEIDRWVEAGESRPPLLQRLRDLVQGCDLKGGCLTDEELRLGIAHIVARTAPRSPAG
jgi:hypothetical protein